MQSPIMLIITFRVKTWVRIRVRSAVVRRKFPGNYCKSL